jgi:hypothetical protein
MFNLYIFRLLRYFRRGDKQCRGVQGDNPARAGTATTKALIDLEKVPMTGSSSMRKGGRAGQRGYRQLE